MSAILYHGSKHPNLSHIRPTPSHLLDGKSVCFATSDIRLALAMIYGTDDDISVGYTTDQSMGKEEMYMQEMREGAFDLLKKPGYLYEVSPDGFYSDERLMRVELVKDTEAKVLKVRPIENVFKEIQKLDTSVIVYGESTRR